MAIGRALVRDPAIYLMDEPLSSLDAKLRAELRLELKRIHRARRHNPYVTHDQVEAMTLASRVGVIRDGRLLQVGTPREIYENRRPTAMWPRGFGTPQINFLRSPLAPDVPAPPGTETIGIRTEHLQIASRNGGALVGRVHRIEHLGEQKSRPSRIQRPDMITLADPHQPLQAGEEVELRLRHPLYFECRGQRIPAIA